MMKKILIIIVTLFFSTSCQDFLDVKPIDIVSEDQIWGNILNAEKVLANLYSRIETNKTSWKDNYDALTLGAATDETKHHWENTQPLVYNFGAWGPNNNSFGNWNDMYKAIRLASSFMEEIESVPIQPDRKEFYESRIPRYKAEARVLRALFYLELFKRYGPVPIISTIIDPSDLPSTQVARNSVDEVVDFIASECDAAANILPTTYGEAELGRMSKGGAMAIKAKALLLAASPLFNGNSMYANVKNKDGQALFPQTYDNEKWNKAAQAAKAVLDLNVYSLYDASHYNPIKNYAEAFYNVRNWKEEIVSKVLESSRDLDLHFQPNGTPFNGYGKLSVLQEFVDSYETANGLPLDKDPTYTTTGFWNGKLWDGLAFVDATNISNRFKNRDPRFYASVHFQYGVWRRASTGRPLKYAWFGDNGGVNSEGWPKGGTNNESGYGVRKWCSPNVDLKSGSGGSPQRNYPVIRLAEIYLMYAEAMNEYQSAPDAKVYAAINAVRDRVSMPKLPVAALPSDRTKEGMRNRIRNEYKVEFAFEDHRFYDVRRWLIAKQTDNGVVHGLNARPTNAELQATGFDINSEAAGVGAFYKVVPIQTRTFQDKHYLMPIPATELDNDLELVQNFGW